MNLGNYIRRKVASAVLLIFLISLVVPLFPIGVKAEVLTDIYDTIAAKYPDEISKMKKYGATENGIRDFTEDLEKILKDEDSLDEDNIEETVAVSIIELYLGGDHTRVFDAVFNGWNLSDEILMNAYLSGGTDQVLDLLPQIFREIGQEVKKGLLNPPDEPDDNSSPGGGGQSGGGAPIGAADTDLVKQLNAGVSIPTIKITKGSTGIEVPYAELKQWINANKPLVLTDFEENIILTIPPKAFPLLEDNSIEIQAEKLNETEAKEISKGISNKRKRVSPIFNIDVVNKDKGQGSYTKATFNQPIKVTISYADAFVTNAEEENLAVYCYDENSGLWRFVGGIIDKDKKTVTWNALHFSKYAIITPEETGFSDITNHWAQGEIEFLADRGIVKGIGENKFAPNKNVTRAEFTTLIVNLLGLTGDGTKKQFADVPSGSWYQENVQRAVKAGIVNGISEAEFAPNKTITRQEMAIMAVNALKYQSMTMEIPDNEQVSQGLDRFKDQNIISHWARNSMEIALKYQILSGRTADLLAPKDYTTRAESAVIIKRILDTYNK